MHVEKYRKCHVRLECTQIECDSGRTNKNSLADVGKCINI